MSATEVRDADVIPTCPTASGRLEDICLGDVGVILVIQTFYAMGFRLLTEQPDQGQVVP